MNWDAILGWTIAGASVVCLLAWFAYELIFAPDAEDEPEPESDGHFTRAGWIETAPGLWIHPAALEIAEARARREARQAYDVVDLLADDECPLEDIALDADGLLMAGEVLADIDDIDEYDFNDEGRN